MEKRSLGLIETMGYTAAIEAADAATKSANVVLLGYEITRAGVVTVKFLGDVGAVKAAVAAGTAAAEKVGTLFASHVIPRLDDQISIKPSTPAAPEEKKKVPEEPESSMGNSEEPAVEPETESASSKIEVAVTVVEEKPDPSSTGVETPAAEKSPVGRKSSPRKPGRKTSGSKGGSAGKKTRGK